MTNLIMTALAATCLGVPSGPETFAPLGEASYKKAVFKLYKASLCAAEKPFDMEAPFSLTLRYSRGFTGEAIAGASIHEMARISGKTKNEFESLRPVLQQCFPKVKKGDEVTGISDGENKARFYFNGTQSCQVEWPGFRDQFFGIWLGEQTREPKKAAILKGQAE